MIKNFASISQLLCLKSDNLLAHPPYLSSLSALFAHNFAWGLRPHKTPI